ncbi:MAG: CoA pyrophosphatase [Myxococcota bacterium]
MTLTTIAIEAALRGRTPATETPPPGGGQAAVAIIVRPHRSGEAECLFIRRAEHPNDPWSGHMAFPGGRRDPADASLVAAAVRETLEEVGVELASTSLLGRLDDLHAVSRRGRTGLVISPFVFVLPDLELELRPNYEVAEVCWGVLGPMARHEVDTELPYQDGGQTYRFPAYDLEGRVIWGLTYRMLQSLFGLLSYETR